MSVTDWFRRLFSPASGSTASAGDDPAPLGIAGGVTPLQGLEGSAAVEGVEEEFEAPADPAP